MPHASGLPCASTLRDADRRQIRARSVSHGHDVTGATSAGDSVTSAPTPNRPAHWRPSGGRACPGRPVRPPAHRPGLRWLHPLPDLPDLRDRGATAAPQAPGVDGGRAWSRSPSCPAARLSTRRRTINGGSCWSLHSSSRPSAVTWCRRRTVLRCSSSRAGRSTRRGASRATAGSPALPPGCRRRGVGGRHAARPAGHARELGGRLARRDDRGPSARARQCKRHDQALRPADRRPGRPGRETSRQAGHRTSIGHATGTEDPKGELMIVDQWSDLARPAGFEPATDGLEVRCSIR